MLENREQKNTKGYEKMIQNECSWKTKGYYDLIVIGAGPAGIGTSIAAARRGLQVALIEKAAFAGGMGTQCDAPLFFGFDADEHQTTGGLADEYVRRMDQLGAAKFMLYSFSQDPEGYTDMLDPDPIGDRELNRKVRMEPEVMKVVYNRMLMEAGVDCIFYTHLADVLTDGNKIKAVLLAGLEGTYLLEAEMFADCTGDAQLCFLANPESVEKVTVDRGMHQSLPFNVGGVTPFDNKYNKKRYKELYAKGLTPEGAYDHFGGYISMLAPGVTQVFGYIIGDATDSKDMTRMDRELREQNLKMLEFLRAYMPGYENGWLEQAAHRVGVRVTRRIYGMETITEEIIFGKDYINPVALCWRHIGGHANSKKFEAPWIRHEKGVAGIPMGTLIPKMFDNVVVAGRCISAELHLVDAYRMMDTCMTTGEAAGLLAYLAIRNHKKVHNISYEELLPLMKENGFILSPQ